MLEQIGDWVNRLVWGPATLGALLLIGIYYTARSRFFPIPQAEALVERDGGQPFSANRRGPRLRKQEGREFLPSRL